MSRADPLPPGSGARLERFAAEFEQLDAADYALFASVVDGDPDIERAKLAADRVIGPGERRAAIRAAVDSFRDWAARAYSNRLVQTDTVFLFQSLADRPEDRVRFAASLERAVVAVILWDELVADDQAALLGPWLAMAERAAAR